jgi:sec-independent protein translocase protein TatB
MFDLTSSKLFLLAIVALLVIGPKDFPILLRTIGKYVGIIRGHAKEFRAQFDEAIRETELAQLKKDMESIGRETEASLNATRQSVEETFAEARQGVETSVENCAEETGVEATVATPVADPLPQPEAAGPSGEGSGTQAPTAPEPAEVAPSAGPPMTAAAPEPAGVAPSAGPSMTAAAPAVERTGA